MATALAAAVLAAAFALMLVLRRGRPSPADDVFLDVARCPQFVLSPPARREDGPAVATVAAPGPAEPATAAAPPPRPELELLRLEAWRREQLVGLGIPHHEAEEAARAGVDAAAVRSLAARGCPPALALRIVR